MRKRRGSNRDHEWRLSRRGRLAASGRIPNRGLGGWRLGRWTFPGEDLPVKYAKYFSSVIAVDSAHKRVLPNLLNRFLLNKESKLEYGKDGSLTLYFAPTQATGAPEGNWLPTLRSKGYSLTFRFYGPRGGVADGTYYPPALQMVR